MQRLPPQDSFEQFITATCTKPAAGTLAKRMNTALINRSGLGVLTIVRAQIKDGFDEAARALLFGDTAEYERLRRRAGREAAAWEQTMRARLQEKGAVRAELQAIGRERGHQ